MNDLSKTQEQECLQQIKLLTADYVKVAVEIEKFLQVVKSDYNGLKEIFIQEFLTFYNATYTEYATFKLLFFTQPKLEAIYRHVNNLLEQLLASLLSGINITHLHWHEYIDTLTAEDLPTIQNLVAEVNSMIKNDSIESVTHKPLEQIEEYHITVILYVYTKDPQFVEQKLGLLAQRILQANEISFEPPSIV